MDFLTELKERVKNGGNCVNLGRGILATNKSLHEWVISETPWILPTRKFNERVYCILNGIHGDVIDAWGEIAKFENLFTGYLLRQTSFDKNQSGLKNAAILEEKQRLAALVPKRTKIDKLAIKYRKKYPELYLDSAIEEYDYKECPVTGIRLKMITSAYITNMLDMSVEEFDRLYPGVRGSCQERLNKVKEGLKEIDPLTGLTKHALSIKKSKLTLSAVDENGLRGYDRKGQKTRATHMRNVDEFGRTGYRRQADYRLNTVLENGLTIEQNAHIKQAAALLKNGITRVVGASKLSKQVLSPIIDYLTESKIKFFFDKAEYMINDPETNNKYFYDLTIPDFNIVIEYQSASWHADPFMPIEQWRKWQPPKGKKKTAEEVLAYDYHKARTIFAERKFVTYYVWQNSENTDVQDILCLLKMTNMKS